MLELLASAAGGGLFGLAGSLIKKVMAFFEMKQKNAHELEVLRLEQANMRMEIEARRHIAEIDLERDIETSADESLQSAIQAEGRLRSSNWVNDVRGLVRPLLTLMLLIVTTSFWYNTDDPTIEARLANELVFMTSAAVLFWFGDRPSGRRKG